MLNGLSRVPPAGASQAMASGPSRCLLRSVQGAPGLVQLVEHGGVRSERDVGVGGLVVGRVRAGLHQFAATLSAVSTTTQAS